MIMPHMEIILIVPSSSLRWRGTIVLLGLIGMRAVGGDSTSFISGNDNGSAISGGRGCGCIANGYG